MERNFFGAFKKKPKKRESGYEYYLFNTEIMIASLRDAIEEEDDEIVEDLYDDIGNFSLFVPIADFLYDDKSRIFGEVEQIFEDELLVTVWLRRTDTCLGSYSVKIEKVEE